MAHFNLAICTCLFTVISATASNVQTFKNVKNGTITCGEDNDCVIICDAEHGCMDSTFNVMYGNIKILCSGHGSCRNANIISKHTLSLNMSFTGVSAFNGHYWGYGDENTSVSCNGSWSCSSATFHHDAYSRTTHECTAKYACSDSTIHVLSDTNIICGDYDCSCYSLSLLSSTNNYTLKVSGEQYTFPGEPVYIFPTSAHRINDIIICDECKLDSILFIPALSLNRTQGCYAWNKSCVAAMINLLQANPFTTVDNYYGSVTYPASINTDILVIFSQHPDHRSSEFKSPKMDSNANTVFEVFCIECNQVLFNFTQTKSVIMRSFWKTSAQWLRASTIYGSQQEFTFVANLGWNYNKDNIVYVNNTAVVNIRDIGYMSSVYLGAATNVNILCWGYDSCREVNVSSTLNPVQRTLFGPSGEWQIKCESKESCEPGFDFYFTYLNKMCPFTESGPDIKTCPFLKPLVINTTHTNGHNTTDAHHTKHTHFRIPAFVWIILAIVVVFFALIVSGLLVWTKRKKRMESQEYVSLDNDNKINKL